MKTPAALGLVLVAVLATVAIEESRFASLRSRLEAVAAGDASRTSPAGGAENGVVATDAPASQPSRVRERPDPKPVETKEEESGDFAKTVRKMWDNPAGKSMMNQGVKMAVAMMYGDFIDGLNLSKEEQDYFRNLLGQEMADQQELGMKMMGATPEEQKKLAEEIAKRQEDNKKAIKAFLNSEDDYKKFEDYKDSLPERQQMEGIRSTMAAKQAPLDAATEQKLADAMRNARKQPGTTDFSGPDALEQLSKGNAVEIFEQDWTKKQEALRKEVSGILNETQLKAFTEYQEQMKEFQLMGLKMMATKKDAAK